MKRQSYHSDLSDEQWQEIESVLLAAKGGRTGRPRKHPLREVWNAIFNQMRTGCAWRYLPHDFPPHGDVWQHFRRWRDSGAIELVHNAPQASAECVPRHAELDSASRM